MSLQPPRFARFTIDMRLQGVAFVAGESDQSVLHEKLSAAIRSALLAHAQDHRVSIGIPDIKTCWYIEDKP